MKRQRKTLLVFGVVALFAAAVGVGAQHLQRPLVRLLGASSGRDIRIDGPLDAHLLALHPTISAYQVSIGNPAWMPSGTMANIGRLALIFEWRLSIRPLEIRRLEIDNATLHLMRDASGRANWHMHAAGPGKGPPLIRSLSMPHAHVELNDDRRHLQFSGTVSAGDASAGGPLPALRIEGAGQLNGRAASFVIDGDPLLQVQRARPYHFSLEEHSNAARLVGRGMLVHPFDLRVLQATFDAAGPDLQDLYFLVGLRLPHTGPFALSGRLARQGMRFMYSGLTASSGQSDMSGTLSVDSSSGRPRIEGQLSSEALRLADLGARAAGLAPEASKIPSLRVPDTPFRVQALRRDDAAIQYRARALTVGSQELRGLSALVSLDRGVLSVEGFKTSLADGTISGSARLDASQPVPRGELTLSIADLRLDRLTRRASAPPFSGMLSGRALLSGQGSSFHGLAASVKGTMSAVVPQGSMRASIADVASLDFIGALGALLKSHEQTGVRCAVASFDAQQGVVTARTFVIDTDKVLIAGTGAVDMNSENLDLTLRGQPKNERLALQSVVSIRGTLRHPQIERIGHDVLAAALRVMLEPLAAVLTSIDPKLPQNADCAALIAQSKSATADGAVQPPARGR